MKRVRHDGRETAYRQIGVADGSHDERANESPVLYVHGSGGTHKLWVHQYSPRGIDRPAVAIDLSGHGPSEDLPTEVEPGQEMLSAYVDDAQAVAHEVGARLFVGNSLGGAVVLQLALERDVQMEGCVLCGTGAKLSVSANLTDLLAGGEDEWTEFIDILHEPSMLFHDADSETVAASREAMRETGQRVTRRDFLTCDTFDVRDRLDELRVPTLAITGEHDQLTPVWFSEFLAERIPSCQLASIPNTAHLSMLEQPVLWNEHVESFLSNAESRR